MKKIVLGVLVLFAFHACKRSTDVIGPAACPSTSFAVLTPAIFKDSASARVDSVNLSTSYALIKAKFNENISYKLTITGESGAQYIYNGSGDSVHLHWYGNSSNNIAFSKGEGFSYALTNLCITEPFISGHMGINSIIGLSLVDKSFGLFVNNGENDPANSSSYGPCMTAPCNASATMTPTTPGYTASPQGGNYYKYKATCTGGPATAYYFGGVDYALTTAANFSKLPTDPTRVYLNFYAKGQHNSIAQMIFLETVIGTDIPRTYNKAVVSDQWTLFSVKLSDLGISNPTQLKKLSFNLGTYFPDTSAEVDLDMVIFTVDKPL
ncbi:MAG TPA: hypothetical protein VK750_01090 [Cytophagaceae bacterium]|jgi:hypothetical protein|nr:hypothetical protein [Cytophagaceae bacterium]